MQKAKYFRHSLLLFFMTIACKLAIAEASVNEAWQKLVNDPAFSYKDQKEALEKIQQPNDNILQKIGALVLAFFMSPIGKLVGWALFFIIIGWTLYKIFVHGGIHLFGKKPMAVDQLPTDKAEAETLANTNWEYHFNNAAAQGDTRMAIRYSYLQLLQLLQRNGLIQYRNDKTNNDYSHELAKQEYRQPFRQLSRQYEYVWYGQFNISQEAYDTYMHTFSELKNRLRR